MSMHSTTMVALLLCASLVTACSKSPEEKIVGTWYEMGDTETIEFFADGTVRLIDGRQSFTGSYSFLDDKRFKAEFGGLGAFAGPMIMDYEFDGDTLRLSFQGDVAEYSRSQEVAMKSINDVRAQVESGITLAAGAKAAISEYVMSTNQLPVSNEQAGLMPPTSIRADFVSSVEIQTGTITINYGGSASPTVAGKSLKLIPRVGRGSVSWTCKSSGIERQYIPEGCQ